MHRQVPVSWSNLPDAPIIFHQQKKEEEGLAARSRYAKANLNPPTAVNLPVIKLLKTCSLERRVTSVPLAVFPCFISDQV